MELKKTLKVRELIQKLQECDPEAEVITTIWNGWVNTYAGIDWVHQAEYGKLSADFFGTPGRTDARVFRSSAKRMVLVCSLFEYDEHLHYDKIHNQKDSLNFWKKEDGNADS